MIAYDSYTSIRIAIKIAIFRGSVLAVGPVTSLVTTQVIL